MSTSSRRPPFHFVFANAGSEKERKRESQLARSHTARVNRQRRLPVRAQSHTDASSHSKRIVQRSTTQPETAIEGFDRFSESSGDPQRARDGTVVEEWIAGGIIGASSSSSSSSASTRSSEHSSSLLLTPRTIAPVLGAQSSETFSLGSSAHETARAADYCINVIWPNLLMDADTSAAWFSMFRGQPIIYHAFMYALTVHHDLYCNRVSWSTSRAALVHKTKTITLLNQIISNLDDKNIEYAILAVLVLASNELKPEKLFLTHRVAFEPHMPLANWNSVYARMEAVPEHAMAMMMLAQRHGGLEKIKMPGLAGVCAFSDLLSASYRIAKPLYTCFWQDDIASLLWSPAHPFLPSGVPVDCGVGFRIEVPSGLPVDAATAFSELAIVDKAMEQCRGRSPSDRDMRKVVGVRNRGHHHILSLPPWEELDAFDQAIHDRTAYESCRFTVLLYSNAVIFPIPPHSGYPGNVLEQLVALLTPQIVEKWRTEAWSLLVWMLVVGGIVALDTEHRGFFERTLVSVLEGQPRLGLRGETPSEALRTAVCKFLWTESACGKGLRELLHDMMVSKVVRRQNNGT